jgi:hypothetical protein
MAQHSALPSSAAVNPARVIVCPEASDVQEFEECVLSTNFRVLTIHNVRNSVSATSQAENRGRGKGLERRTHAGVCAQSQAAELFRRSLSDKERGNGRQERGWG